MPVSAIAFLVAFVACTIVGLARTPLAALAGYLLVFYVHPPSRWWGAMLPSLRWSLLAAAIVVIAVWIHRSRGSITQPWHRDTLIRLFALYIAWMWIQTPWAADQAAHLEGVTFMTKYLVIIYVIVRTLDSPRKLELFALAHVLGCMYLAWLAYEIGEGSSRLDGVGGPGIDDANTLGMQLATGIVIGSVQLVTGPLWSRIVAGVSLPIILNALVLTQSRGAFLGLAVGGAVLVILAPRKARRWLRVAAALGVLCLGVVAHQQFWQRMETISTDQREQDFSSETRVALAQAQLRMFRDHPLGIGHRGTGTLSPQYLDEEYLARNPDQSPEGRTRTSHNMLLTVLVEQGFVGAVIFVALMIVTARRLFALRRAPENDPARQRVALQVAAIAAAFAVVLIAGQFADYLRAEIQSWLIGMLVAATALSSVAVDAPAAKEPEPHQPLPHNDVWSSGRQVP